MDFVLRFSWPAELSHYMAVTHVHEAEDKVSVGISVPPGVGSVEVTIRIAPTTSHAPVTVVPDEPRADQLPVGENGVADEVPDVDDPIAPPTHTRKIQSMRPGCSVTL
jgi:hypothetical protein